MDNNELTDEPASEGKIVSDEDYSMVSSGEDNGDLMWSLSIKWIDDDNIEQYSFDSCDEDMLEEIIEDEPCWYEED